VRTPEAALDRHIADSLSGLAAEPLRSAAAIVDLGAGAGFPGLVLAVARPDAEVDLVEATARKCAVIERLAGVAGITNARAVPQRAEEWAAGEGSAAYDVATARAVAPLAVLLEYAAPLLAAGGALVAWKGRRDPVEEATAAAAAEALGMGPGEVLTVTPFAGAENRHLHVYPKVAETPEKFPRRAGVARKRPLA
jgi:16S rRNA (guanine527-N7)-methyltransferase